MGRLRWLFWIAVLGPAVLAAPQPPRGDRREPNGVRKVRRLLVIGPGTLREPVAARVGEVIQFTPFALPVAPRFLGASYELRLEGDRTLEPIGELTTPSAGEGRSGRSVFFFVRDKGRVKVELTLRDEAKKEIAGYGRSYIVESQNEGVPGAPGE